MAEIRIGLIGCGRVAQSIHLPLLTRLTGVRLVALAEPDPIRRDQAARLAPGVAIVADANELLGQAAIDAVVICLPTPLHAEVATAAFDHHKHVYLEKPLATDLAEAEAVVAAWRAAGTVGMIGFNYRFNPLLQAAKQALRDNRVGELVAVRSVFSAAMTDLPDWRRQRASGGGALLELASHHIDTITWLVDQPVRAVSADLRSLRSEHDTVALHLRLADGLPVDIFCSFCSVEEDRVEIYGREGKLSVDRYGDYAPVVRSPRWSDDRVGNIVAGLGHGFGLRHRWTKLRSPGNEPSYDAALSAFAAAVREGRPASPDLMDGYRGLAVIAAAEAAARTGRSVELPLSSVQHV